MLIFEFLAVYFAFQQFEALFFLITTFFAITIFFISLQVALFMLSECRVIMSISFMIPRFRNQSYSRHQSVRREILQIDYFFPDLHLLDFKAMSLHYFLLRLAPLQLACCFTRICSARAYSQLALIMQQFFFLFRSHYFSASHQIITFSTILTLYRESAGEVVTDSCSFINFLTVIVKSARMFKYLIFTLYLCFTQPKNLVSGAVSEWLGSS